MLLSDYVSRGRWRDTAVQSCLPFLYPVLGLAAQFSEALPYLFTQTTKALCLRDHPAAASLLVPGRLRGGVLCDLGEPAPLLIGLTSGPVSCLHTYGKFCIMSLLFTVSSLFPGRHRKLIGMLVLGQLSGLCSSLLDAVCAPWGCSRNAPWSRIMGHTK